MRPMLGFERNDRLRMRSLVVSPETLHSSEVRFAFYVRPRANAPFWRSQRTPRLAEPNLNLQPKAKRMGTVAACSDGFSRLGMCFFFSFLALLSQKRGSRSPDWKSARIRNPLTNPRTSKGLQKRSYLTMMAIYFPFFAIKESLRVI